MSSLNISNCSTDEEDLKIEQSVLAELKEKEKRSNLTKKKIKEEDLEIFATKESFYLSPVKKYLKYKKKRAQYKKIHSESKFKYHSIVAREVVWKYFRKRMFSKLLNTAIFSAGLYFFYTSGLKDKIIDGFKFIYSKFKSIALK